MAAGSDRQRSAVPSGSSCGRAVVDGLAASCDAVAEQAGRAGDGLLGFRRVVVLQGGRRKRCCARPPECLTEVQLGLTAARRRIGNLLQILLGLFQPAFAQGQIQEYPAGVIGLRTIAPALDDLFGQGLQSLHRRRPRLVGRTAEQGFAGRKADPCRLTGGGRIAGGLGQRFAQGGRFVQFARGVAEIGQVIAHRVIFFRAAALPRRAQVQRQLAVLQGFALRGGNLLLALALRIAIVACAGALGLFLLGLGGEETVQGRLGMIAGVGKGSRFARLGRAQRRIEQTDLGLRLVRSGRGGHEVELLPRPVDLLGPQSALLERCGRQGLQHRPAPPRRRENGWPDRPRRKRAPPRRKRAADDRPPATAGRCPALLVFLHLGPQRRLQGLHGGLAAQACGNRPDHRAGRSNSSKMAKAFSLSPRSFQQRPRPSRA